MVDDVAHLGGAEPEVDRHVDASGSGDAEHGGGDAGGVVGHDRDPFAHPDAELVERGRLGAGPGGQVAEGEVRQWRCRLVGFIDQRHTVPVDRRTPVEEVHHAESDLHPVPLVESANVSVTLATPAAPVAT